MALDSRGFIAAPLLGTLIFLAAIVFVGHVTQVDKTETAAVVSDAYHNRIVNVLEDYRSDLGVLFSVNVGRAIEKYLTEQCWYLFIASNTAPQKQAGPTDQGNPATVGDAPLGFTQDSKFNYDDMPFCANTELTGGGSWSTCKRNPKYDAASASFDPLAPNSELCSENCNGQVDYYELRYMMCTRVSRIIRDGICPYNKDYGITAWIDATRGVPSDPSDPTSPRVPYSFEGIQFSVANDNLVQDFVSRADCEFSDPSSNRIYRMPIGRMAAQDKLDSQKCYGFDGQAVNGNDKYAGGQACDCNSASGCAILQGVDNNGVPSLNTSWQGDFGCAGKDGTLQVGEGINRCNELIGNSLFDCRNFAVPQTPGGTPNRCCDLYYNNPTDPADAHNGECCNGFDGQAAGCGGDSKTHVIPGCELGTFFVKINVTASDALYKMMPRLSATDKTGNTIRAGAVGENSFLVQVKYPLYQYLDAALKMYAPLAYGVDSSGTALDFSEPATNSELHSGKGRFSDQQTAFDYIRQNLQNAQGNNPKASSAQGNLPVNTPGPQGQQNSQGTTPSPPGNAFGLRNGQQGGNPNAPQTPFSYQQGIYKAVQGNGATDQGKLEGVIEGICYGAYCNCDPTVRGRDGACLVSNQGVPFETAYGKGASYSADYRQANKLYYDTFFDPNSKYSVCRMTTYKADGGVCEDWGTCSTQVWVKGNNLNQFVLLCPKASDVASCASTCGGSCQDCSVKKKFYYTYLNPGTDPANDPNSIHLFATADCRTPGKSSSLDLCAYINNEQWNFDFRDFDARALVFPDPPADTASQSPYPHNRFCWYAEPYHYDPLTS